MIVHHLERRIDWKGHSNKEYLYSIYPVTENHFPNLPGSFIFTNEIESGVFLPIYIAHTLHLQHEISFIKRLEIFKRHSLSHIHIHINWSDTDRLIEVKDLIRAWNPSCNQLINLPKY